MNTAKSGTVNPNSWVPPASPRSAKETPTAIPSGKLWTRQHAEDQDELLEVGLLVLLRIDFGVHQRLVREDHEYHTGEHPDPDLCGRPLGEPLVDEPEQRRRQHDPGGEPHNATLPRSLIES